MYKKWESGQKTRKPLKTLGFLWSNPVLKVGKSPTFLTIKMSTNFFARFGQLKSGQKPNFKNKSGQKFLEK